MPDGANRVTIADVDANCSRYVEQVSLGRFPTIASLESDGAPGDVCFELLECFIEHALVFGVLLWSIVFAESARPNGVRCFQATPLCLDDNPAPCGMVIATQAFDDCVSVGLV